jgi:hypothetical protein
MRVLKINIEIADRRITPRASSEIEKAARHDPAAFCKSIPADL